MSPVLGVFLHAIGGFAAGSFYLPLKKVADWSWESYWLVNGFFSWLIMPWVVALLIVPDLLGVLGESPARSLFWAYFYGLLWGVGGLTFGLTMRYLGISLGTAIAIGFTAAFGTLVPPIYFGEFVSLLLASSGQITITGTLVTLLGIAVVGWAGTRKDRETSDEVKAEGVEEFDLMKGVMVATFSGIMSACMAFGIAAGEPIAETALAYGTPALWQNTPIFVVVFAGGLTTNVIWCVYLHVQNGSVTDYFNTGSALKANYLFAALAGVTWYCQFMFYGMGETQMGEYEFASWSIHTAFIIAFGTMWGLATHEWKGASRRTMRIVYAGLAILVLSTVVIGVGNYIEQL